MKYLADENIEKPIVDWLRDKGEDVYYVPEESPSLKDSEIINIAKEENRILLTNDKDFGELVFRQKKVPKGVILIRAANQSSSNKLELIKDLLKKAEKEIEENFVVVNEAGIRIRKM